MAKIFVHVTRVKNAMGFEQPITTLTSISGKPKKNDYVCGKCGAKLTRQDVLSSDGTCPKCGEPIHMGTAFLNRQKNVRVDLDDVVSFDDPEGRKRTGRVLEVRGTELVVISKGDQFRVDSRDVMKNANLTEKDITPGNYKTFMKTPSNWEEVPGSNGYKWTHIPTGKTMSSKVRGELMRRADVFHGELRENGARWSTTDIYPQVEGKRKELIKDPSKSLGETLKPGKPGTLANEEGKGVCSVCGKYGQVSGLGDRAICDKCLEKEMKGRNSTPPDSGFEKEAAIAERRGSSMKNGVSLDDPALLREIKSLDRQGYSVERLVKVVLGYNPNLDPQEVKQFVLQARRNAGTKNADRSRPTDVDTWDDVPGMNGRVKIKRNTEGRKSNPGWLASKDEGKWSKAKEAVKKEYGEIKWPVVTKVFEKMGGKPG